MKLSKGTTFEFTISILLISLCLIDIKNYWFTVPFGIASILTIIDCLIKWFKIRKDNNNKIINTFKPKKIYYVILIVSLILNIVFTSSISFLLVNENNQKKENKRI